MAELLVAGSSSSSEDDAGVDLVLGELTDDAAVSRDGKGEELKKLQASNHPEVPTEAHSESATGGDRVESRISVPFSSGASYLSTMRTIAVHPLDNYTIGSKEVQPMKDVASRFIRMKKNYQLEGQRRTAQAVMMVHRGGHPHILMLRVGSAFFRLPGGRLKPGQDEREGLLQKLTRKLAPLPHMPQPRWEIDELLSTWWRPNFETYVVCLPSASF
jgi:hypothetical protein